MITSHKGKRIVPARELTVLLAVAHSTQADIDHIPVVDSILGDIRILAADSIQEGIDHTVLLLGLLDNILADSIEEGILAEGIAAGPPNIPGLAYIAAAVADIVNIVDAAMLNVLVTAEAAALKFVEVEIALVFQVVAPQAETAVVELAVEEGGVLEPAEEPAAMVVGLAEEFVEEFAVAVVVFAAGQGVELAVEREDADNDKQDGAEAKADEGADNEEACLDVPVDEFTGIDEGKHTVAVADSAEGACALLRWAVESFEDYDNFEILQYDWEEQVRPEVSNLLEEAIEALEVLAVAGGFAVVGIEAEAGQLVV